MLHNQSGDQVMENHQAIIVCSATESPWIRHFSVGEKITTDRARYEITTPIIEDVSDSNFAKATFTEASSKTINRLLSVQGVIKVTTFPTELQVEVDKSLDGEELENVFLQIIKDNLFPGLTFHTQERILVA
jgi:hypothetical protein